MPATRVKIHNLVITFALCSVALFGQQKPAATGSAGAREFPVTMRQKIEAGKTPVGTRVEAELTLATLSEGTVIPRDAIFFGEVIESAAKSGTEPSRLAIRMDEVRWKKGSAPVKVYLTAWYYPIRGGMSQDLTHGPDNGSWNGMGAYPVSGSPATQPFPKGDNQSSPGAMPSGTASSISDHRVLLRDVESKHKDDGTIVISSTRSNVKLDKLTTYVLAADELQPSKESPKR